MSPDPEPRPITTGKYARADRVLVTVGGKPVVGVMLATDGPVVAYDSKPLGDEPGRVIVAIVNPADIICPLVVSQELEAMRRLIA